MAAAVLVAFTTGSASSADQTLADGAIATLIPRFEGKPGKVVVEVKNAAADYQPFLILSSRPARKKDWQIVGPMTYRVSVRNAGCDVDAGAV